MNISSLKDYLKTVAKEGYATNEGFKNADHSSTIFHTKGSFSMKDTYFGGEPYGGSQVIFYDEKPVWIMTYYGFVEPDVENIQPIYALLKKALAMSDSEFPLRGPRMFIGQGMQYMNHWDGTIERFEGKEQILKNGVALYSASYTGGLVNSRLE